MDAAREQEDRGREGAEKGADIADNKQHLAQEHVDETLDVSFYEEVGHQSPEQERGMESRAERRQTDHREGGEYEDGNAGSHMQGSIWSSSTFMRGLRVTNLGLTGFLSVNHAMQGNTSLALLWGGCAVLWGVSAFLDYFTKRPA